MLIGDMFEYQNYLMTQAADSAILRTQMLLYLSCGIKFVLMCEHLLSACVHAYVIRLLLGWVHLQSLASGSKIQSDKEERE